MSLSKEFHSLRQQIDVLFENLVRKQPQLSLCSSMDTPWIPAIELQETNTELWLKAQLPGIEPSELEIQVSENAVFLSGEYRECHQHDKQGIFRSEFHYGQFKRVVPLPIPIQRERVTAAMAGGLLTLIMPKAIPVVPNLVKVALTASDPAPTIPVMAQKSTV
jgi:HSP20 family protein